MPMSTAIQLTKENISRISDELRVDEEKILQDYINYIMRPHVVEPVYYVTNALVFSKRVPYLIYGRSEFLNEFESVPPGIQYHFVLVKPITKSP